MISVMKHSGEAKVQLSSPVVARSSTMLLIYQTLEQELQLFYRHL